MCSYMAFLSIVLTIHSILAPANSVSRSDPEMPNRLAKFEKISLCRKLNDNKNDNSAASKALAEYRAAFAVQIGKLIEINRGRRSFPAIGLILVRVSKRGTETRACGRARVKCVLYITTIRTYHRTLDNRSLDSSPWIDWRAQRAPSTRFELRESELIVSWLFFDSGR